MLCLVCLPGVSWWLCGSFLWCHGIFCGMWLWYFLILLTYYFLFAGQYTGSFATNAVAFVDENGARRYAVVTPL